MHDFSKLTIRKLVRKGIYLLGLQFIPGPFGGSTAYVLNDNGCSVVRTFQDVLAMAE